MRHTGQIPYLDQNDAHEQSLGQSDGSLPGPEQTLNHSINQSSSCAGQGLIGRPVVSQRIFWELTTVLEQKSFPEGRLSIAIMVCASNVGAVQ